MHWSSLRGLGRYSSNSSDEKQFLNKTDVFLFALKTAGCSLPAFCSLLKCFKDSVRTPLPSEEDGLFVGREDNTNIDIYKEDEKIA